MRSGLVISKRRIIDYCIAKGNDIRVQNNGTPEEPILIYPIFRFNIDRNYLIADFVDQSIGPLAITTKIVKDNEVLNVVRHSFGNTSISAWIGDNKARNQYPAGILELYIRTPVWMINVIKTITFQSGGSPIDSHYNTNFIDISKLKGLQSISSRETQSSISNFIKFPSAQKQIRLFEYLPTTVDIYEAVNLRSLLIRGTNIESLIFNPIGHLLLTYVMLQNNKLTSFNLVAPNLNQLDLKNNISLGSNINLAMYPELLILDLDNCGMTSINLTYNTKLKILRLGPDNNNVNNNNLGANITGNEFLSELEYLSVRSADNTKPFKLDDHPKLKTLYARHNSAITAFELGVNINENLTYINTQNTPQPIPYNFVTYPNLSTLLNYSGEIAVINTANSTKLTSIYWYSTISLDSGGVIDLSNNSSLNAIDRITGSGFNEVILPIRNMNMVWIHGANNLTTISNVNVARSKTSFQVYGTALSSLDLTNVTSITTLVIGGGSESYTNIPGLFGHLSTIGTLNIQPTPLNLTIELGINIPVARFIVLKGDDLNISYNTRKTWLSSMRRLHIRPSLTSGLATSSDQVANLIIDLSVTTWATGTLDAVIPDNAFKVIDLRGNCAVATPSTALTTALNLLTTKGVTVLRNT